MINFFGIVHACGGCGTEILGAIELLRGRGVPVRLIVPTEDPIIDSGNAAADYLRSIGVELVQYVPGMFATCRVLMVFGEHKALDYMREHDDRPLYVVYSDCMSYATDNEIGHWRDGFIDEMFFQSTDSANRIGPVIARQSKKAVKARAGYKAYINVRSPYFPLRFSSDRSEASFRVLRVCRDDPRKWHPATWRMVCGINAPSPQDVFFEVVGWGPEAAKKIGDPTQPSNPWFSQLNVLLNSHVHDAKLLSFKYTAAHVMVHVCDYDWEESLGRTILEAVASGTVVITDNRGGGAQLLRNGETGFLVDHPDEAAFHASEMAFYPKERRSIAAAAYTELVTTGHGNPDVCLPWWQELIERGA